MKIKEIFKILFVFLIFFVIGLLYSQYRSPLTYQPVSFPHKKHIEQGLECNFCHKGVLTERYARFPLKEVCSECHSEPLTKSKREKKLLEYISSEGEIPWQKILRMPEDVYFSHKTHTVFGEIQCSDCHGKIFKKNSPPLKPIKRMRMKDCISCHTKKMVTVSCEACHR